MITALVPPVAKATAEVALEVPQPLVVATLKAITHPVPAGQLIGVAVLLLACTLRNM